MQNHSKVNPFNRKTWKHEQVIYFGNIEKFLTSGEEGWIANGKPEQLAFLIAKFFEHASGAVRIFSRNLIRTDEESGQDIYANPYILSALEQFLSKRNKKCSIILDQEIDWDDDGKHPLIEAVKQLDARRKKKGKFNISRASTGAIELLHRRGLYIHFMLKDANAMRLKTNHEKVKAHVTFGKNETLSNLSWLFDEVLIPESKPVKDAEKYRFKT